MKQHLPPHIARESAVSSPRAEAELQREPAPLRAEAAHRYGGRSQRGPLRRTARGRAPVAGTRLGMPVAGQPSCTNFRSVASSAVPRHLFSLIFRYYRCRPIFRKETHWPCRFAGDGKSTVCGKSSHFSFIRSRRSHGRNFAPLAERWWERTRVAAISAAPV